MANAIYVIWILFWFVVAMKCVADDYKEDKAKGNLPSTFTDVFLEYIGPFLLVVVVCGFGVVGLVAKFLSWVAQ